MVPIGAILTFTCGILVALLLLDTVPLQESMVCDDYTNYTDCPEMDVWSQDYFEARAKFRAAAARAGAELRSHNITDYHGVPLTTDEAFIAGAKDRLLIHISGTHGVEGFAGSALQTHLLARLNHTPSQPSLLFIHALNPYGFAALRRFNEHNVDLNRNDLTEEETATVLARDPNVAHYEDMRPYLDLGRPPRWIDRYRVLVWGVYAVLRHGYVAMKRALVTGQNHDARGLYYGGNSTERSMEVLRSIVRRYKGMSKVVAIDVHTGLGPKGVDCFMVRTPEEERGATFVWGPSRVRPIGDEQNAGYDLAIGAIRYARMLPTSDVIEVTEEFGTVNPLFVGRALILENAGYHHARGTMAHQVTRWWLRDAFYPQDIAFKRAVLRYGGDAFWRATSILATGW